MAARYTAKDRTAIVGLGLSPYSRDRGATTELSMVLEASVAAIRDAGLAKSDIDGVVGGGLLTGGVDPLTVVAGLGLDVTYWAPAKPPIMNHLTAAVNAVHAGSAEAVLVYHAMYRIGGNSRSAGGDPFRQPGAARTAGRRAQVGEGHTEQEPWGMFGGAGYAAWASRYLFEYPHTSREDFGLIAINDRSNAARNDNAVFRTPLTMEDYLAARMIREPLCLLDMDVPDRRGRRIRRDHRRAGERPSAAARAGSRRDHGNGASPRGAPHHRSRRTPARRSPPLTCGRSPTSGGRTPTSCSPTTASASSACAASKATASAVLAKRATTCDRTGTRNPTGSSSAAGCRSIRTAEACRRAAHRGPATSAKRCSSSAAARGNARFPDAEVAFLMPGGLFFNAQGLVLRAG